MHEKIVFPTENVVVKRSKHAHTARKERQLHAEGWKKSGLTKSEYARQNGLSPSCLFKWTTQAADALKPPFKQVQTKIAGSTQTPSSNIVEIITDYKVRIRLSNVCDASFIVSIVQGLIHAADH